MFIEVQCASLNINPLTLISPAYLSKIKQSDPHPRFATFIAGIEGTSKPKVLETGFSKVITWTKKAIKEISENIKIGLACLNGHTKNNEYDGEEIVGTIAGVSTKQIGNRLATLVAVYFPKDAPQYDCISLEGDVQLNSETDTVEKVFEIKRFALGDSNQVTPAFPEAQRVGMIQCMVADSTQITKEGNSRMTFNEVKQAVRDLNIFPSQLWTLEELIGHFEVKDDKGLFYGGVDNKLIDSINRRIPDIKKFKDEIQTKEAKLKELEENVKLFQEEKASLTKKQSEIKLREYITGNPNLDTKQKTWIEKKLSKFKPENGSEEEIKSFVDEQLVDYKEFIALHNDKFMVENAPLLPDENVNGIPKGYI